MINLGLQMVCVVVFIVRLETGVQTSRSGGEARTVQFRENKASKALVKRTEHFD